ncbi:MAG TPA: PA2169 family four-helix-bundle protein [Gemmatimonadaceae bacterium]|nr:PA2169 family four-helix-bundle protein [Gemmatimonadaceae bacterium]
MAMSNDDVISVLNDLIETSEDGIKGFRECAEHVQNPEAKTFFNNRVALIERGLEELRAEVRRFGGDPEHRGSVGGALHRAWIDLRAAVTSKDDHALLAEAERGEDVAVKNYKDALNKDLPPEVRAMVERQYRGVLENHDRVRALRDTISSTRSATARPREVDRGAPPPP